GSCRRAVRPRRGREAIRMAGSGVAAAGHPGRWGPSPVIRTERLALAGFPAGYRGLTREAYTLDLRQFTGWCRARSLPLFSVRRADIETFPRELEAKGRARAAVTRRLSAIAGVYNAA